MRLKSRFISLTSVVLAATISLTLIASPLQGKPALAADAKTLTVAFSQEPDSLNEYYTNMAFAIWAAYLAQANLWDYDDKLQPVPVLVSEIPTTANGGLSQDGKTTTLKLKKGLKWSDGQPLTADDVVFTYQMIMDKANKFSRGSLIRDLLNTVEKVDDLTVKVTTKTASPYPENLAGVNADFQVLPMHIFKAVYDKDKSIEQASENQNPTVFSGPYMLKEWKRGASLTYVVNPNYAGPKPQIEQIVIQIFPQPETAYAALAAGQIDFIPNLQPADAKTIEGLTKDVTTYSLYGSYRESLWLNLRDDQHPRAGHPALKDARVRQAIRKAINRRGLVKDLLFDKTTVADSLYSDSPFENKKIQFAEYDLAGANKLLDDAGWKMGGDGVRQKDGVKLELIYGTTTAAQRKKNQAVIQQQLAQVGIKITLQTYDPTKYFGSFPDGGIIKTGVDDIDEYANNTVTTNPANQRTFFCNDITSDQNPGGQNYVGYCNQDMDKLWSTTEQTLDPKQGQTAADKIQEMMNSDVPIIILYNRNDIYAYRTSRFAQAPHIGAFVTNQWYDIANWKLQ